MALSSPPFARYNTLRLQGLSPEDAAARVAEEFPEIADDPTRTTVTAGPITPASPPSLPDRVRSALFEAKAPASLDMASRVKAIQSPPVMPKIGTGRPTLAPLRGPMAVPDASAVASDEPALPSLRAPTIGPSASTPRPPAVPEPTMLSRVRERVGRALEGIHVNDEGVARQNMSPMESLRRASVPGSPEADEMMLLVAGATNPLARKGAPKIGKAIVDQPKFPSAPAGPHLPGEAPSVFQSVPARAAGELVPDVPLFAPERPRMFKETDFDLSPQGRQHLEQILGPTGLQQRVSWDAAKAVADQIGADPAKILRNVRDLSGEEILAVKQAIATDAERVVHLSKIAHDPATTAAAKSAALEEIDRRSADLSAYAARVTRETSQKGRDLNLMKVMAKNTMEPSVWLVQGSRMKGLPLTPEETARITQLAAQRDREGLFDALSNLRVLDPLDKAIAVWKAGLLTNPVTHLVNVTGNTAMAGMEQAKDAPAAVVDMLMSLGTGTRTKAMPRLGQAAQSVHEAFTTGLDAAKQILRTGATAEDMAKWDFRNGRFGKTLGSEKVGRVLDLYTQSVFRSLGAEDQIFKAAAVGRSLDEQIRVEAMNIAKRTAGTKTPMAYADAAKMLRANVPDAMQAQAIADAEFATFQNDNLISGAVSAGKKYLEGQGTMGKVGKGIVETNLPFVKTPSNVLERTLDYTPAGILRAIQPLWKMAKGQDMTAAQRQVAEAFGRSSLGSLLIWAGYEMAGKDLATGSLPQGAKDEWDVRGRIAGAVRTSPQGDWHQTVRMQPIGTLLALGADLRRLADGDPSASDVVGGALASTGKIVAAQPFLQGISNIAEAVSDPEKRGGSWLRSTAASVVPAVVSAAAREVDPIDRDPKTIVEAIRARVPGASKGVAPKLNVFGQPQSHESFPGAQLMDITRTRPNTETPALAELRRLGVKIGRPSQQITVDGKTYALSPDEYRTMLQQIGPETQRLLEAALLRPGFQKERETPARTDLARRDLLQDAISQARARYEAQLAGAIHRAEKQGSTDHAGTLAKSPPRF